MAINLKTLKENLSQSAINVSASLDALRVMATSVSKDVTSVTAVKYDGAISACKQAIRAYNALLAAEYYLTHGLTDIIAAGDCVPAFDLALTEEDGWNIHPVRVYPTLSGLVDAGLVDEALALDINTLRFLAAIIMMGDTKANRDAILSHAPKKVAANLPEKVSNTQAKVCFDNIMVKLTGKHGSASMWKDFQSLSVKRGNEWGKRGLTSSSIVGDIVLEYAYLTMNGKRLTVEAKQGK